MTKEEVWMQFAAVFAAKITKPEHVMNMAALADLCTAQWSLRFSDMAVLLDGQTECAACHKPTDNDYVASIDGLKFCSVECLKGSGREE